MNRYDVTCFTQRTLTLPINSTERILLKKKKNNNKKKKKKKKKRKQLLYNKAGTKKEQKRYPMIFATSKVLGLC